MSEGNDGAVALARGGRVSVAGLLLRLAARMPFLLIAGRVFGAEALGRYGYAVMVVELAAQLATLGLRRGLAAALEADTRPAACVVADAMALALGLAALFAGALFLLPGLMFPAGAGAGERGFALVVLPIVATEIALAALACRGRIEVAVWSRSIVEPWVMAGVAGALALLAVADDALAVGGGNLMVAYGVAMAAACVVALWPVARVFGWPGDWRPHTRRLVPLARANVALAGAEVAEWASRRMDVFILGLMAPPAVVGVYFAAQQLASVPQKLKSSFDPVLAPVLAAAWARGDRAGVARQVRQVGFWIGAAQLGIALALGFPAGAILRVLGEGFGAGAGTMAVLLVAEAVAATAVVAEAALIFRRRGANLWISLGALGAQAALTVPLVVWLGPIGAAVALLAGVAVASGLKAWLLAREVGEGVSGWRWRLGLAVGAAGGVGVWVPGLPDWAQIVGGIWVVLAVYCFVAWRVVFRGDDRLIFARLG